MLRFQVQLDQQYSRGKWRHRIVLMDTAKDLVLGEYHDIRAARDAAKDLNAMHQETAQ